MGGDRSLRSGNFKFDNDVGAQNSAGALGNGRCKIALQPIADKIVGGANDKSTLGGGQLRLRAEPKFVAFCSNASDKFRPERGRQIRIFHDHFLCYSVSAYPERIRRIVLMRRIAAKVLRTTERTSAN